MTRHRASPAAAAIGSLLIFGLIVAGIRLFVYAPTVPVVAAHEGTVRDEVAAPGTVQTRIAVNVSSKLTGVLERLYVDQGDVVHRGELLATLVSTDLAAQAAGARTAVTAADQNVAVAQSGETKAHATVAVAQQNIAAAEASVAHAQAALAAAQQNVTMAEAGVAKAQADLTLSRSAYARTRTLLQEGAVAAADMDTASDAMHVAEANAQNATAAVGAARAGLRAAEADVRSSTAAVGAAREALAAAVADTTSAAGVAAVQRAQAQGAGQNLEYANASLAYARITSPMDGIIIQRNLEAGSTVVPGSPIFTMAGLRDVWSAAHVDETVVGRVKVGQPARIHLRSGQDVAGRVVRITHQADSVTRELEVDVQFTPTPTRFTLNEEADVSIEVAQARGLIVPASAVTQGANGQATVFVARGGKAVPVAVRPELTVQAAPPQFPHARTVLLGGGVAAGDLVIAQPQGLKAGQRVHLIALTVPAEADHGSGH